MSDFFREVVPVLFQPGARIQFGFFGTVQRRRNCRFQGRCQRSHYRDTGSVWGFNLVFADDAKLPATFRTGGDSTYLLGVLNSRVKPGFVFDQQILPRFRALFGFCAFAEANLVVFLIVVETRSVSMSPCYGGVLREHDCRLGRSSCVCGSPAGSHDHRSCVSDPTSESFQQAPPELADWTVSAVLCILDGSSARVSSLHDRESRRFRRRRCGHGSWQRRETTSHGLSDAV
ncbi:MAG: hypothetical protein J07HQW1_01944 [Haloquadratum walsbyi J07HQW1]|uniref:Uncharacterized protein n=1 Tax=Haloquadratum walsbyi J07HQW1 TaxID=1238424 RepID=U1N5M7_9EURY|nr:MAG: hypothetical protein J07HQW1_01944 [Haloquadratum walsbyi J07HQW1]